GAEALGGGFTEGFLKVVHAAEGTLDGAGQFFRRATALVCGRCHPFPEKRVVHVAAAVVAHGGLGVFGQHVETLEDHQRIRGLHVGLLEGLVQVLHVGGVMLVVVDRHRQGVDVRFQRGRCIGQRREREWEGGLRGSGGLCGEGGGGQGRSGGG